MEPSRWGIIYCPKDGVRHIHKEWEAIRSYLTEKGVLYDFVQSEGPKSVERLAAMLASNGYTTIVIVGGDAALNRALNGVCYRKERRFVVALLSGLFLTDGEMILHIFGVSRKIITSKR